VLVASLLMATAIGCGKERLKVAEEDPQKPNDYNRTEFLRAVSAAQTGKSAVSAKAFRTLAARIRDLWPGFSESVQIEAERALVFMAIQPMEAAMEKSPIELRETLALTVWPTALLVEPEPGETAAKYVERICADKLALKCKYSVAEYRPVLLASMAWRNLKERARDAYAICDVCVNEPKYKEALASFDKHDRIMSGRAGNVEDIAHPRAWPFAGQSARPWTKVPVLSIKLDGTAMFGTQKAIPGKWRDVIARSDTPTTPLGVYLRPKDRVRTLRAVLADAAAVGYKEVSLQVRSRKYPYDLLQYRVVTKVAPRQKIKKLMVRDIDTIQVLVQSLDANAQPGGAALAI